jgi:hypothetical protein
MSQTFADFLLTAHVRDDMVDDRAHLLDAIRNTLFQYGGEQDDPTIYDVDLNLEVAIEDIQRGRTDPIVVENLIAILKRLHRVRDLIEDASLYNGK